MGSSRCGQKNHRVALRAQELVVIHQWASFSQETREALSAGCCPLTGTEGASNSKEKHLNLVFENQNVGSFQYNPL